MHRLKADGTPILSWGTPGTDAGEFQLVHNICGHPDGDKVVVCDRENSRVQVFIRVPALAEGLIADCAASHRQRAHASDLPSCCWQVFDFEGNFISESSHHRAVSCAQGT